VDTRSVCEVHAAINTSYLSQAKHRVNCFSNSSTSCAVNVTHRLKAHRKHYTTTK